MSTTKVDLYVSQLIEDLSNGLSWSKADDFGFGSIQEKYGANEIQIKTIQKHPKLVGLEPSVTIFNVIDDLKETVPAKETLIPDEKITTSRPEPTPASATKPDVKGPDAGISKPVVPVESGPAKVELPIPQLSNQPAEVTVIGEDSTDSSEFFNL